MTMKNKTKFSIMLLHALFTDFIMFLIINFLFLLIYRLKGEKKKKINEKNIVSLKLYFSISFVTQL